jgi:[acyl-carrier-protein] S-malonyltransferase
MTSQEAIRADLKAQLTSRVRWTESIRYLAEEGITHFLEVGSGRVLSSMVKRVNRKLVTIQLGEPEHFDRV